MGNANITISVEEETKRQFAAFCENVGMNMTTAFNMFIKNVLRTRQLPFTITDITTNTPTKAELLARGKEALRLAQTQAAHNGASEMTLEEINEEIAAYRKEKQAKRTHDS